MGLNKKVKLSNGIELNYHRIDSLDKMTNERTTIVVRSYLNKEGRENEAAYNNAAKKNRNHEFLTEEEYKILEEGITAFSYDLFFDKKYNETETIKDVYAYLKTIEPFIGAEDDD